MPSFKQRLKAIDFDFNLLPNKFNDCVQLTVMDDPVFLSDGHVYDRKTAKDLLLRKLDDRTSPKTREPLTKDITRAHQHRADLIDFIEEQERKAKAALLLKKIEELQTKLNKRKSEVIDLEKLNKSQKNKIGALEKQATKEKQKYAAQFKKLEQQHKKASETIQRLQTQIHEQTKSIKELESEKDEKVHAMDDLKLILKKTKKEAKHQASQGLTGIVSYFWGNGTNQTKPSTLTRNKKKESKIKK